MHWLFNGKQWWCCYALKYELPKFHVWSKDSSCVFKLFIRMAIILILGECRALWSMRELLKHTRVSDLSLAVAWLLCPGVWAAHHMLYLMFCTPLLFGHGIIASSLNSLILQTFGYLWGSVTVRRMRHTNRRTWHTYYTSVWGWLALLCRCNP